MSQLSNFNFHAQRQELSKCEELLTNSNLVNFKDKLGNTLLLDYIHENNVEIAKLLIRNGADVNANNVNGQSCLIKAAMNSQEELVDLLLEMGANPNYARTNNSNKSIGSNALMYACEKDNLYIVQKLINITDINYVNDNKQDAFMYACKTPGDYQKEKISLFVDNKEFNPDKYDIVGNNYLEILARHNNLALLHYCVIQLELYNPKFLTDIQKQSSSTIKKETVEYIEDLYEKLRFRNILENKLPSSIIVKKPKI